MQDFWMANGFVSTPEAVKDGRQIANRPSQAWNTTRKPPDQQRDLRLDTISSKLAL
ncbi:uncharacterized protein L203_101325 [Cryptococcus depauperatus CBS 7841]|uniref:Uncharacterized protein n=1 Tax=Cryptococcus depauperatus CBS 7841 TaxID=1295531 RepID=A0AAJ8JPV1_9TREE